MRSNHPIKKDDDFTARVFDLLLSGETQSSTAKKLKKPKQNVNRIVRKLEKQKMIEAYTRYPKLYRLGSKVINVLKGVDKVINPIKFKPQMPLWTPHKFGASFLITEGQLNFIFDSRGKKFIKKSDHTAIFTSRNTLIIWLKELYLGTEPEQILQNGKIALERIASYYARKYNLKTTLNKIYDGIEWACSNEEASDDMANKLKIKRKQQKEIGQAIFKNGDTTHDNMEINVAPNEPQNMPTRHATALHLSAKNLETLKYLLESSPELLKLHTNAIVEISKTMTVLDQKIEFLNLKIDKK
jgi:hypothetical protein